MLLRRALPAARQKTARPFLILIQALKKQTLRQKKGGDPQVAAFVLKYQSYKQPVGYWQVAPVAK
jgi:hypothetical protein